jgi:outer membrane protein
MTNLKTIALAATILSSISMAALANDDTVFDFDNKHNWMIRLRAIDVHPDSDSSASGASVFVDNIVVPELDITYFWTDNIATELILATSKHDVDDSKTLTSDRMFNQ